MPASSRSVSLPRSFVLIAAALLLVAACADGGAGDPADTTNAAAPQDAAATSGATIVDAVMQDGRFSTLATALDSAGLAETLRQDGPYTVFAPTDSAFDALPEGTLDELLQPEYRERLATILRYHVVDGSMQAADLEGRTDPLATLEGSDLEINASGDTVTLGGGSPATVTEADVQAGNGVIHVIDAVLMPPNE